MSQFQIAVLVGSLRKESFNRKMAHALAAQAPSSLKFEIIEIGEEEKTVEVKLNDPQPQYSVHQ